MIFCELRNKLCPKCDSTTENGLTCKELPVNQGFMHGVYQEGNSRLNFFKSAAIYSWKQKSWEKYFPNTFLIVRYGMVILCDAIDGELGGSRLLMKALGDNSSDSALKI